MKKVSYPTASQWDELLSRPVSSLENMEKKVLPIMQAVADDGDAALRLFSKKFDGVELDTFAVTEDEIQQAVIAVAEDLKTAIQIASDNIEKFHKSQQHEEPVVETQPGVICWRKSVAIDKVGLYIPGGTAPLFSTVLMLAIPARLAGCQEIILCTPPNQQGDIHPAILYAAHLTGVHKIYKVGGAQAIAAMTFGTETIPKVYKVLGPGNQYVMAAKQIALRHGVAIDMPAGPSEVAVIADKTAEASFVAADLLSQAEHGIDSQVILFSDDEALINKVEQEVEKQLAVLPRTEIATKALENSRLILVQDLEVAMQMSNVYAPEHLILQVAHPEALAEKVTNAGSVFLGHLTPESAGDYASGTNHTLPTNGYAKAYSGVSLDTFVKKITFQKITSDGLKNIGGVIEKMAAAEELEAHKNAVSIRLKSL